MKTQFNGERLKKARIYRGLTVAELAEQVGCQRQTLSMYEISKSQPTDKSLVERLSHALNFPIKFFYETPASHSEGTVYFRSLLTTNKKYRSEQIVKMDFLSQVYSLLQDYISFPTYEPLNLPEGITPEEAAYALREAWDLGHDPIDNIISVVEQHGILVTSFSTSTDDVDAFSQFVGSSDAPTYLIAYSNNKTSAARIHFDIAHELGHICLHEWSEDIEELTKEEFKRREREANDFAAAFLLRRAEKLNIITKEEYQALIRIMQRRGQRKEEPLDDVLITAAPALLKASVMMLLQENVFTAKEFMDELSNEYKLSISPEEVEYLLDLPVGTLAVSKIIDFNAIKIKRSK